MQVPIPSAKTTYYCQPYEMDPSFAEKKRYIVKVRMYVRIYSTYNYDNHYTYMYTSNKNIHFEMILDVGIGEKRKETRFLI